MRKNLQEMLTKRDIILRAFRLKNGNLWLEGEFFDIAHLIRLEFEVDPFQRKILKAQVEMPKAPYPICLRVLRGVKKLRGLTIEKGVLKKIANILGGPKGCVHLKELAIELTNFAAGVLLWSVDNLGSIGPVEFEKLSEKERYELSKNLLKGTCLAFPESNS